MAADVQESAERTHESVFHIAENEDLDGLVRAYLKEDNLLAVDPQGNNILHIAAQNDKRTMARGIVALTVPHALWEKRNSAGKTPIDIASARVKKDLQLISVTNPKVPDHHTILNKELVEERIRNPNENYKVMMSLDGGGIKAILQARILQAIEHELDDRLTNHLHWLGGTSCGGISSVALGVGLSVEQTFRIFLSARYITFCGNNRVLPKHDSKGVEDVLRQSFGAMTTMADLSCQRVMVTAAKVKAAPPQLVLFRSYAPRTAPREYEKYGYMNPSKILAWKAARATSAAPVFFESYHGLADGAIFCNNPCMALMTDFFRLQKLERHKGIENNDKIGCIVSIGCGVEPVVQLGSIDVNLSSPFAIGKDFMNLFGRGKNLITLFLYQCTASHAVTVGQAREWAHSLGIPYFRLSPRLTRAFDLDSVATDCIFDFMFETEVYLKTQVQQDIKDICRLLKALPKSETQNYHTTIR
ncbi:Intracelllar PhosphoLipase A family [Trichostrongylus colubriformis]|uniref:Intracelllar PhosphoLipase A family n=1 Tax=Trichostrongylus colubriformis TaxID=6319 RepID=A0AAN8IBI9_TRICO